MFLELALLGCFQVASTQDKVDSSELDFVLQLPAHQFELVEPKALVEKCSSVLEKYKELSDDQVAAVLLRRGTSYFRLKKFAEAQKDFDRVVRLNPKELMAQCYRAVLMEEKDGLKEFDRILAENPGCGLAHWGKSAHLIDAQRVPEAIACLDRAIDCFTSEKGDISSKPLLAKAMFGRALARFYVREFGKALDDINQALQLTPYFALFDDPADVYKLRGAIFLYKEQPKDALVDFQMAVKLNPKAFDARFGLISAMFSLEKYAVALSLAEELATSEPREKSYELYLRILLSQKLEEKALKEAEKATALKPGESWPYAFVGQLHVRTGNYTKAVTFLDKALDRNPHCEAALPQRISLLAGCPEAKFRDGPKAKELAQKMCDKSPSWDRGLPLLLLSIAYAECGEFGEALKALESTEKTGTSKHQKELRRELRKLFEDKKPYRIDGIFRFDFRPPGIARGCKTTDHLASSSEGSNTLRRYSAIGRWRNHS